MLNAGAGQTLSVTFTPTDATNYTSATAAVLITVLPVVHLNAPPVFTTIPDQTSAELASINFPVAPFASDPEGEALTFSAAGLPDGLAINPDTGVVSGTLGYESASGVTLAWDPSPSSDVSGYIISYGTSPGTYTGVFDVGNRTSGRVVGLTAGQTYYFTVTSYFVPGELSTPSNEVAAVSSYTVTVTAKDPELSATNQTFNWTVANVNRAPSVDPIADLNTAAGTTVLLSVIATDLDGISDSLTYTATSLSATSLPADIMIDPRTGVISGTVSPTSAAQSPYTITVTATDNALATASRTFIWTVPKTPPTITWPAPAAIGYGTALNATQLDATAHFGTTSVAGTFVYTPAPGTVLNAGVGQTLSVTFTPTDAANYTTATATVTIDVTKATPTITWPAPAAITYGTALSATQLNATASVAGTFVYTPAAGTVLNAGAGQTLSVTFTPTDTANYTTATASVTIDVTKATPTITWPPPAAITYGTALSATQLNATASVGAINAAGTFVYTPAAGTVLNAGAGQTLSVTFTPTDAVNYVPATASVLITVKATPTITWATPADLVYGTALSATQLNATASVPGTFVYSPAAGTVLSAGAAQTLSVTFTPTDAANYTTATATVTITVAPATPAITWNTPAGITYPTALSGTQLNASTILAGRVRAISPRPRTTPPPLLRHRAEAVPRPKPPAPPPPAEFFSTGVFGAHPRPPALPTPTEGSRPAPVAAAGAGRAHLGRAEGLGQRAADVHLHAGDDLLDLDVGGALNGRRCLLLDPGRVARL